MNLSISSIHGPKRIKIASKTEASLTAPEVTESKENQMLTQLKQEIREAQYACKLMEEIQGRLKEAYLRLEEH